MADNLIRNTWTKLDSHELRLLLHKRIGGPGQFDGREDNPNMFYSNFLHDGSGRGTLGEAGDAALEIGLELLLADITQSARTKAAE